MSDFPQPRSNSHNNYVPRGAEIEILRRALTGRLINPETRITKSLIEVLADHFKKIDTEDARAAVQRSLDRD